MTLPHRSRLRKTATEGDTEKKKEEEEEAWEHRPSCRIDNAGGGAAAGTVVGAVVFVAPMIHLVCCKWKGVCVMMDN